eukprot:m.31597 g.31597  ORF g.31597 m.31597 type:complete len:54 (+) comp9712_c1_seq1:170-331(+)
MSIELLFNSKNIKSAKKVLITVLIVGHCCHENNKRNKVVCVVCVKLTVNTLED